VVILFGFGVKFYPTTTTESYGGVYIASNRKPEVIPPKVLFKQSLQWLVGKARENFGTTTEEIKEVLEEEGRRCAEVK